MRVSSFAAVALSVAIAAVPAQRVTSGVFLLRTWPRSDALPRFRGAACAVAAAGALLVVAGFALVAVHLGP